MKLKDILIESIPRIQDHNKIYYHGFSKEEYLKDIQLNGLKAPDLTNRKGNLRPIDGKVYITPDLRYAIIYSIGGDMLGIFIPKSILESNGLYGYLAIIDGKQLLDIQPDEDDIGQFIHDKKFYWLNDLAQRILSVSTYKKVMNGEYEYFARAGKVLVKKLSDDQKLSIIDSGSHIAHGGNLKPKEIWKFDKSKSNELLKDGSNFFKLASKI